MRIPSILTAALAGIMFAMAAPSTTAQTIVDIAASDGNFSTLVAAVVQAGLDEPLSMDGNYTVFAPTDSAFAELGNESIARLLSPEWSAHLESLLLYHVLGSEVFSASLTEVGQTATTLEGNNITVTSLDPITIDSAEIIIPDIDASNGVIHAISGVLLPTSATESIVDLAVASNDTFSTLVDLVVAANLTFALSSDGPFTVLAPTNEAFAALGEDTLSAVLEDIDLLTDILLYHVVPSIVLAEDLGNGTMITTALGQNITIGVNAETNGTTINDANVLVADILASNGVIHAIDKILMPAVEDTVAPNVSVVEIVSADFSLSALARSLIRADLVETLEGEGPFTVFAPNNDAFDLVDEATVVAADDDPEFFASVLLNHVVEGLILSSDLMDGSTLTTLDGGTVTVSLNPVMVNDANVLMADILASNGVVHVIDKVLVPGTQEVATQTPTSSATLEATGSPTASSSVTGTNTLEATGSPTAPPSVTGNLVEATGSPTAPFSLPETSTPLTTMPTLSATTAQPNMAPNVSPTVLPSAMATTTAPTVSPTSPPTTAAPTAPPTGTPTDFPDIVDIALADASYSTLVDLLTLAGLVETLQGEGPFTVFAPTNDAFSLLDEAVLEVITSDVELLSDILLYHVIEGQTLSSDLTTEGAQITTLNGDSIVVFLTPKMINDGAIVSADLLASNGVMHAIDRVLLPPFPDPVPIGSYDEFAWIELPAAIQLAGAILGYNETSWDNELPVFSDELFWDELTVQQQEAAAVFGYDQTSWDVEAVDTFVTITYNIDFTQGLASEPGEDELDQVVNATIDIIEQTMDTTFNDTFIGLSVVRTTTAEAPGLGWEVGFVADLVFSETPTSDEIVAAIQSANYTEFLIENILPAGPYFAQTSGIDLIAGATIGEAFFTDAPTTTPETSIPSATAAPVVAAPVSTPPPTQSASQGSTLAPTPNPTLVPAPAPIPAPVQTVPSGTFQKIVSVNYSGSGRACIEIEDSRAREYQDIVLEDCSADQGGAWNLDSEGLMRSELDPNLCWRAQDRSIKEGVPLRLRVCDAMDDFQKFTFQAGNGIRSQLDNNFCVAWRGNTAHVGDDPILLRDCEDVRNILDWRFE